ncbi:hypothetical protein HBNXNv_0013 [Candidatus Nanohalovita haloferacivicina]|nr:hypothetical protein HBNXNv_0013 [Candidatus Nanohalobia archaeon BNXNv]
MNTGLAFSDESGNDYSNAVFISKDHKKRLKKAAKAELGNLSKYRVKLFSVGLFMLIQNDVHRLKEVRIDKEYEGKFKQIKHHLNNFLQNNTKTAPNNYPKFTTCEVHKEIEEPECHNLAYKAREKDLEHLLESDYSFLKAMILKSNK